MSEPPLQKGVFTPAGASSDFGILQHQKHNDMPATQVTPYLTFDGNCREAMGFYKECFGGELTLQTVAETPAAAQCPAGMQQHIMHSMLQRDGFVLMATDMSHGPVVPGNDMALTLGFSDEASARQCFDNLASGGAVIEPLAPAFWGALFGVVKDRFGKVWMFNHQL